MKQSLTLEAYTEELADPREALAHLGEDIYLINHE